MTDTLTPSTPAQAVFYVTGGTLSRNADCYVERDADRQLYDALQRGEFCDVLTSRQMGKSSLMVRVAARLRQEGAAVAILDITALGQNLTPEQWYEGLLMRLGEQLKLEDELEDFWDDRADLPPLQRWMQALRTVVMEKLKGKVVVFVDEIDFVRSLNFPTDEFFAAVRECYNRRAIEADYNRLTFCLLGVATPSDLIRDTRTTPFNIGRRIELPDFSEAQAGPLAAGLGREPALARRLIDRILHWTGGHPYLTQRLCKSVAEDAAVASPAGVDRLCRDLFLGHRARERDDNLIFVRDRMLRNDADRAALLDVYRRLLDGREVADDETNPLVAILRLSGIARAKDGKLQIRNRIYAGVFDRSWVTANMPDAELRRQKAAYRRGLVRASAWAAGIIIVIGIGIYAYFYALVMPYTRVYRSVTMKLGMPEGLGELTPAQASRRAVSYRVIRKGSWGPVKLIEAINGRGQPTVAYTFARHMRMGVGNFAWTRESQWRFGAYEHAGQGAGGAVYEQAINRYGQTLWSLLYSPPEDRAAGNTGRTAQARFVTSDVYAFIRPSAQNIDFQYDADGREAVVKFTNFIHQPEPGSRHACTMRQTFDGVGRVTEATYEFPVPPTGSKPAKAFPPDPLTLKFAYGATGNLERVTRVLKTPDTQCAQIRFDYDADGNPTGAAFLDSDGKPAANTGPMLKVVSDLMHAPGFEDPGPGDPADPPFSQWKGNYTEGRLTDVALFDAPGNPAPGLDGYNRWAGEYDGDSRLTARVYADDRTGRTVRVEYDDYGAERTRTPSPGSPEPSVAREYYPDSGHLKTETAAGFDPKRFPFARRVRTYDAHGYERSVLFQDAAGKTLAGIPTRCRVAAVTPGSRADYAYGFRRGDSLLSYASTPVHAPSAFYDLMFEKMNASHWANSMEAEGHGKRWGTDQMYSVESGLMLEDAYDPSASGPATREAREH